MKVIDLKAPKTGHITRYNKKSVWVKWHNGRSSLVKKDALGVAKKNKHNQDYKILKIRRIK